MIQNPMIKLALVVAFLALSACGGRVVDPPSPAPPAPAPSVAATATAPPPAVTLPPLEPDAAVPPCELRVDSLNPMVLQCCHAGSPTVMAKGCGFTKVTEVTLNHAPMLFTVVNDETLTFIDSRGSPMPDQVEVDIIRGQGDQTKSYILYTQ
jgi:hypothetical protein